MEAGRGYRYVVEADFGEALADERIHDLDASLGDGDVLSCEHVLRVA